MALPVLGYTTPDNYLAIERQADVRYEYHYGILRAMAGGTIDHSTICNNIAGELRSAVKGRTCTAFNSEMKIEVARGARYVYSDAGVACPKLNPSEVITGAITNPTVVVEVYSEDSEGRDRGDKLRWYGELPSVREYLLLSQSEPLATLYRRRSGDTLFTVRFIEGINEVVTLESIGIELSMQEIYADIEFPPTEEEE